TGLPASSTTLPVMAPPVRAGGWAFAGIPAKRTAIAKSINKTDRHVTARVQRRRFFITDLLRPGARPGISQGSSCEATTRRLGRGGRSPVPDGRRFGAQEKAGGARALRGCCEVWERTARSAWSGRVLGAGRGRLATDA